MVVVLHGFEGLKMKRLLIVAISSLPFMHGCGDSSPWQGPGALYFSNKGQILCVDAESVTFSFRSAVYVFENQTFDIDSALDFHPGEKCNEGVK